MYHEDIPYRGEPQNNPKKHKKQFRNLKAEKRISVLVIGICVLVMIALLGIMLSAYRSDSTDLTPAFKIGLGILAFLVVTACVADGLKSINKFRKGYDIDISEESEKADREQSEDLNA